MSVIPWGIFVLSPLWIPLVLFAKWKKLILSRFRFLTLSFVLLLSAFFAILGFLHFFAEWILERYYLSGMACSSGFECAFFNFFYSNKELLWPMIYVACSIVFVAILQWKRPKLFGFFAA